MVDWILLIAAVVITVTGLFWRRAIVAKMKDDEVIDKRRAKQKKYATAIITFGGYVFVTRGLTMIFGNPEAEKLEVSLMAPRLNFLGLNISTTILYTWYIMAFLVIVALVLRFTVLNKMKDIPKGVQNVVETAVEAVSTYVHGTAHGLGDGMSAYIFAIAAYLVCCAGIELFGLRTPASDVTLTFSLAFITFLLINVFGFKKKGVMGRLKQMANPTPIILPIKIITDLALPVSMACRLFGNMLGGMIVMDLLYTALGNNAIGIPSVLGLYFNVFHPLIQAYIFVTLTLTFINEAIE